MAAAKDSATTRDDTSRIDDATGDKSVPGLVLVFSGGKPCDVPFRIDKDPVELGRVQAEGVVAIDDERVSRRHTRVEVCSGGLRVKDLGSRNGTLVDGRRVDCEVFSTWARVVRVGQTLLLALPDIRPFLKGGVDVSDLGVVGPRLRPARAMIARVASGDTLLITGPSGSGKELAARLFHKAAGRGKGPFVAVNCAAIPSGLAERLLFGTRRGAYSGATADAEGHVQAAHKGTLFLDEIAELDGAVQPKLLRVLESHEVIPLGGSSSQKVDVQICAATLKDLGAEVKAGRFREDLYYRIGRPEVRLPALKDRLEEVPWLIVEELRRVDAALVADASFVEACLLRDWPGNVRELLVETRQAARAALADGRSVVEAGDLAPSAGRQVLLDAQTPAREKLSRKDVEEALAAHGGNVSAASRALGLHRTQLRRLIERYGVDPKTYSVEEGE